MAPATRFQVIIVAHAGRLHRLISYPENSIWFVMASLNFPFGWLPVAAASVEEHSLPSAKSAVDP